MKRLVAVLGLALASLAPALTAEEKTGPGGDTRARQLWRVLSGLVSDEKYPEAEKVCLDILSLNPSPPIVVRTCAQLSEIYCTLRKFDKAQEYLTRTEEALKNASNSRMQAKALYLRAVLTCQTGDTKGCVEQLKKAVAVSDEAILWTSENKVSHFADLMLLDEASPLAREFRELSDPANQDKELRSAIKAKCEEAKKTGQLVLLDFYGGW